jgi:L-alanine-DL-glutamate epimerase-like enolase superfamily enzyme
MRISRIEVWPHRFRLAEPYTIAYETVAEATNVFVRIIPDIGAPGLGVAAPDPGVTGETAEDTETVLRLLEPLLVGKDPLRRNACIGEVESALAEDAPYGRPSARAAIEMALLDLLGKHAGLPVWRILGGYRASFPTSITIGILGVDDTVERARTFAAQGFQALKIKGGLDPALDAQRVIAVRKALPEIELRFDANQGYTEEQTLAFVAAIGGTDLRMLEQPTPWDQPLQLARLTEATSVSIMADECLLTVDDAFTLARGNRADMVNIKLMKLGGIGNSLRVDSIVAAAGIESMVGSMDECALGIAAGLAFALARRNVRYVDLDGHLDLVDDPTAEAVRLENGVLFPSERSGFGWNG